MATYGVAQDTRSREIVATADQTVFGPLGYYLEAADDMVVELKDAAGIFQTVASGYTVTGAPGFPTITFDDGREDGEELRFRSVRLDSRGTDVTHGGGIKAQLFEQEQQRFTRVVQELRRDASLNEAAIESLEAADVTHDARLDALEAEALSAGLVAKATNAQMEAGTEDDRYSPPAKVLHAINYHRPLDAVTMARHGILTSSANIAALLQQAIDEAESLQIPLLTFGGDYTLRSQVLIGSLEWRCLGGSTIKIAADSDWSDTADIGTPAQKVAIGCKSTNGNTLYTNGTGGGDVYKDVYLGTKLRLNLEMTRSHADAPQYPLRLQGLHDFDIAVRYRGSNTSAVTELNGPATYFNMQRGRLWIASKIAHNAVTDIGGVWAQHVDLGTSGAAYGHKDIIAHIISEKTGKDEAFAQFGTMGDKGYFQRMSYPSIIALGGSRAFGVINNDAAVGDNDFQFAAGNVYARSSDLQDLAPVVKFKNCAAQIGNLRIDMAGSSEASLSGGVFGIESSQSDDRAYPHIDNCVLRNSGTFDSEPAYGVYGPLTIGDLQKDIAAGADDFDSTFADTPEQHVLSYRTAPGDAAPRERVIGINNHIAEGPTGYSPTLAAQSGALGGTTIHAADYWRSGTLVTVAFDVEVTAAGTGATGLTLSLPVTGVASSGMLVGREVVNTGDAVVGQTTASQALIRFYDGSYPGATNARIIGTIQYQAA